jgi:hypothetical protein
VSGPKLRLALETWAPELGRDHVVDVLETFLAEDSWGSQLVPGGKDKMPKSELLQASRGQ